MSDGIVFLVGAGPGDPGLLTVRARELIDSADAIVYDALVPAEVITDAGEGATPPELHYVGKRGGDKRSASQSDISALLVQLARQGKRVVRLKGGDPFVFGRGGEEAQALFEADIRFEVVPGVTAGIAAPAYAGIPVTHRGRATSVTLVTGHEDPGKGGGQTDWSALARLAGSGGTVVVYMGAKTLPTVIQSLLAGGLDPHVPAAAVSRGTQSRQQTVVATVETIVDEAARRGAGAPMVVVFGWTVLLRDEVAWAEQRPLFGKTVVVTRATQHAGTLSRQLREQGARVLEMPATKVARLDSAGLQSAITRLQEYQWLVFTSQNAVNIFWEQLLAASRDARALAGMRVAAVGPGTAAALLARGIIVDVVPERFVAEGLLDALRERSGLEEANVLYVTAEGARDVLRAGLEELGARVDVVQAYRSVRDGRGAERLRRELERGDVSYVTVTSASAVKAFVDLVGEEAARAARLVSIGPATSAAAREAGLEVAAEAEEATMDSLVRSLARAG
ncbi:MAG TPA: uroporphyrinogen-III C-methyltransferase [Gemmatimonadaceae bacterium]|nr:uroporphyrinogen-III C-methyltransferase [Gemmatimonadaceae bacterium]